MKKKVSSFMTSKYILIVLTAVCLIFISTSFFTDRLVTPLRSAISMVVVPLQKGMNNLGLWTYDKYTTLQEISVVLDENKELKSKVDDLTEENNQLRQDTYELSRLRELYQLDEKYTGYTKVGARIIEVTADNWSKAFKVDKGSDDGIKKDMNVIAGGGLVGIVGVVQRGFQVFEHRPKACHRHTASPLSRQQEFCCDLFQHRADFFVQLR